MISILRHGWHGLDGGPAFFYFVDMEFCESTLDQYIVDVSDRHVTLLYYESDGGWQRRLVTAWLGVKYSCRPPAN